MECISFFSISMLIAHVVIARVAQFDEMISNGDMDRAFLWSPCGCKILEIAAAMVFY